MELLPQNISLAFTVLVLSFKFVNRTLFVPNNTGLLKESVSFSLCYLFCIRQSDKAVCVLRPVNFFYKIRQYLQPPPHVIEDCDQACIVIHKDVFSHQESRQSRSNVSSPLPALSFHYFFALPEPCSGRLIQLRF